MHECISLLLTSSCIAARSAISAFFPGQHWRPQGPLLCLPRHLPYLCLGCRRTLACLRTRFLASAMVSAAQLAPLTPAISLQEDYGVPEDQIFGIRYGLRGFLDRHAKPVQLSRSTVDGIQLKGGTVLVSAAGVAGWPAGSTDLRSCPFCGVPLLAPLAP